MLSSSPRCSPTTKLRQPPVTTVRLLDAAAVTRRSARAQRCARRSLRRAPQMSGPAAHQHKGAGWSKPGPACDDRGRASQEHQGHDHWLSLSGALSLALSLSACDDRGRASCRLRGQACRHRGQARDGLRLTWAREMRQHKACDDGDTRDRAWEMRQHNSLSLSLRSR